MTFAATSSQIAEEMFGSKPITYIRSPVGSGAKRPSMAPAAPEAVIGNSMLMHQAMIKVVREGGIKAKGGLAKQVAYIAKKGTVEVERANGDGDRDLVVSHDDVIKEWEVDFARADPRMTFFTYHMIVSYPRDTDDAAARIASEEFASRLAGGEYGDNYKYMIAHHRDTNNPHAHVIINRIGETGRTLQINRQSISADDLRQLHVETAREVGINLNATSRFSRGIDRRSVALGRIKAEQEGRGLADVAQPEQKTGFPFYGAEHRQELDDVVLTEARLQNIRNYQIVAGSLGAIASKVNLPVVDMIGQSINALKQGKQLKRSDNMTTENLIELQELKADAAVSVPQNPREALDDINKDVRVFFEGMLEKVEKIPEEGKRSDAEAALSRALQQYQPLMDAENRELFGKFFVEEDRSNRENSAAYQRSEAISDIRDNRTDDLAADRLPKSDREVRGQERLSKADQDVVDRFTKIGFSGDLAMDRIRQGTTVDKETRQQWFDRDVKTHANTNSLSEKQARTDLIAAYGDATGIYKEARKDIRNINRADIGQTRTEQPAPDRADQADQLKKSDEERLAQPHMQDAFSRARETEFARLKSLGYDDAHLGGNIFDIEEKVKAQVLADRSLDKAAPDTKQKHERVQPDEDGRSPKRYSVTGTVQEIGEKLYRENDPNSSSPYIKVKQDNGVDRDVWGVGLPDMIERYRLKQGDRATLTNIGNETVEVPQTDPKTGERTTIMAERRAWEASNIDRASRTDQREDRTDQRNNRDDDSGVSR